MINSSVFLSNVAVVSSPNKLVPKTYYTIVYITYETVLGLGWKVNQI